MSRRALGSEHASQFSTGQSIVAEFRRALCFQAMKRLICKKVVLSGQESSKWKKDLVGLEESYQDRLVLHLINVHMY